MASVTPQVPATADARLPLKGRLLGLSILAGLGGLSFLPFLAAASHQPLQALAGFAAVVTLVATAIAWPGLLCADAVGLPMPYMRRLDGGAPHSVPPAAFTTTLTLGVGLGVLGIAALRLSHAPALPGSVLARALSTVFAAGPLEIVLHLGVMSVAVWVSRGRRWVGVLAAALALVGFHLTGGGMNQPPAALAVTVVGNGAIGIALGFVYAAHGFEFVVLGHAVAHLITVLGGS